MLYHCPDYHKFVPHAPHDWTLGDTPVECPGRFDSGGSAGMLTDVAPEPDSPSGTMTLTPFEEHLELERATGRPLQVA